jgi:hypothetical protein
MWGGRLATGRLGARNDAVAGHHPVIGLLVVRRSTFRKNSAHGLRLFARHRVRLMHSLCNEPLPDILTRHLQRSRPFARCPRGAGGRRGPRGHGNDGAERNLHDACDPALRYVDESWAVRIPPVRYEPTTRVSTSPRKPLPGPGPARSAVHCDTPLQETDRLGFGRLIWRETGRHRDARPYGGCVVDSILVVPSLSSSSGPPFMRPPAWTLVARDSQRPLPGSRPRRPSLRRDPVHEGGMLREILPARPDPSGRDPREGTKDRQAGSVPAALTAWKLRIRGRTHDRVAG